MIAAHRLLMPGFMSLLSMSAFAEVTVQASEALAFEESVGQDQRDTVKHNRMRVIGLRRFVICVDGLKLLQTVGPAASGAWGSAGYNLNPAVSTVQLYEERDGRVVPVRCK